MDFEIDYFDGNFIIKHGDTTNVKPFDHIYVVVNCDQPLSRTHGPLEREVESYLSDTFAPLGLTAKWTPFSGWVQKQRVGNHEFPRISKLGMELDLEI